MKCRFKSSAMDTQCLVSVVTHLSWIRFLKNFFASSSLQQFQVKLSVNTSELKWPGLRQTTTEHLDTLKSFVCSSYVSIEPTMEQNSITEME